MGMTQGPSLEGGEGENESHSTTTTSRDLEPTIGVVTFKVGGTVVDFQPLVFTLR
jgi:hypothetical protein